MAVQLSRPVTDRDLVLDAEGFDLLDEIGCFVIPLRSITEVRVAYEAFFVFFSNWLVEFSPPLDGALCAGRSRGKRLRGSRCELATDEAEKRPRHHARWLRLDARAITAS